MMKMKRILSLIVAVLMIIGTMGTVAFAENASDVAYVAKLGEDQCFESVSAAFDAAYNAGIKDVVITLIGDTNANTTDSIDLYNKYNNGTAFNRVTLRQENTSKPYYLQNLYTGWTMDKFVFDGVNIVITGQFYAINKVELINNSTITRSNDVANFVVYGNMFIEPGSKYISQVDRISSGSSLTVDGGRTDGAYNSTADCKTIWLYVEAGNTMTMKNGAYVVVSNYEYAELEVSGTVDMQDSKLDVFTAIRIGANGVLKLDANSIVNTPKIIGTGKIVIDATGMPEGEVAALKKINLSSYTGAVELANANDLELVKNADGTYSVQKKAPAVAKIGDKTYETLTAALAEAQAGNTITLLDNVLLTGKFTINKAITIDGDGHSIIADSTAVWYTVSGKLNLKSYKTHLIGVNSDNVTLKNVVLDNNNNAAGINIYCAQNVVFDNVSIINASKGQAALTVNGSTLTVKTKFEALGNGVAIDISQGSGVTSALGVTVEEGTVFDLGDKTVKFASVANNNMLSAKKSDGTPYFAAMDNAYYYTTAQMASRTTAYNNGLILLDNVELAKDITIKGTLNLNGKTLKIADGNILKTDSNLTVEGNGTIDCKLSLTKTTATITGPENLDVATSVDGYRVVYENGAYSVEAFDVVWYTNKDAGFYLDGETPTGMMRFLFLVDIDAEKIEETGIKYIKIENIEDKVNATGTTVTGNLAAFYGDVVGIENGTTGEYAAVAYVKIKDGGYYWSDAVVCSPDFETDYSDYSVQ